MSRLVKFLLLAALIGAVLTPARAGRGEVEEEEQSGEAGEAEPDDLQDDHGTMGHNCPSAEEFNCDPTYRYRDIDGSCNNLQTPWLGKAYRPLHRLQDAVYGDGIGTLRLATNGRPLPSARAISNYVFREDPDGETDPIVTYSHVMTGLYVCHDTGHTPIARPGGVSPECGDNGCSDEGRENEDCAPIGLDGNDPVFADKPCLKMVRSEKIVDEACHFTVREQMNDATSFVDLSDTYGSGQDYLDKLRDPSDPTRGQLIVTPNPQAGRPRLEPYLPQGHSGCSNGGGKCFTSGDQRVNMVLTLTAYHVVFHRHHNHIEERLYEINPHWDGEKLFQESRHINIAIWNNIVYKEFLPLLIGPAAMESYGLSIAKSGPVDTYNARINPEVASVFSTAAYRYGHSMVPAKIALSDYDFVKTRDYWVTDTSFSTSLWFEDDYPAESCADSLLLAMMSSAALKMDEKFIEILRNSYATESPPFGPGNDLIGLIVQRGRDHGLASYLSWRRFCNLDDEAGFEGLQDIPAYKQAKLDEFYNDPEDVDVFVGGVMENAVEGGVVGPLFSCLIGDQFMRWKTGDRFWFERDDPVTGFTEGQRQTLRQQTSARVHCEIMDRVDHIQGNILMRPGDIVRAELEPRGLWNETKHLYYSDDMNPLVTCDDIPALDLEQWRESPPGRG